MITGLYRCPVQDGFIVEDVGHPHFGWRWTVGRHSGTRVGGLCVDTADRENRVTRPSPSFPERLSGDRMVSVPVLSFGPVVRGSGSWEGS